MSSTPDRVRWVATFVAVTVSAIGSRGADVSKTGASPASGHFFEIQVVDNKTGRGVPLVELETVNHLVYVTDSAGRVAFHEPGLMEQPVYFFVRSHGYAHPKDGFGNAGQAMTPVAGRRVVLELTRHNVAERLYRLTGEGIYRDSVLLGKPAPLAEPLGAGKVAGQDSAFAVVYRGRLHWFWGDTSRMSYPLGHFWMAGAVSLLPGHGGLDPAQGVNLTYFTDSNGFSRPVCRLGVQHGMIWADAFLSVADEAGRERLVCHYAHMESLNKMLGHGLAIYDDASEQFERVAALDLDDTWRFPAQAHPVKHAENGIEHFHLGEVFPNVRVRAQLNAVLDPTRYEAWTCLEPDNARNEPRVRRDAHGRLAYAWRRDARPMDPGTEQKLLSAGRLQPEEARYLPVDVETGERIRLHRGSVNWNQHRRKWVMIATQLGGTSALGEVWYSEADDLTGPWLRTRKIVTHERYSFYNPVHHACFDQENGRLIYFEGTYVNTFSGNPAATPRYDYNQIMYRLDLDDPRLVAVRD